jgi:hypothetical protein
MQRVLGARLNRPPYLPFAETQAIMSSLLWRGFVSHDDGIYRITWDGRRALDLAVRRTAA